MQERFHSIQYLRGIAALMVVFTHLKENLNGAFGITDIGSKLFSHGIFGVDLFFIISGFIIHQSTLKKEHSKPLTFIIRRIFRIYPVFIFCVFTFIAIAPGIPQPVDLAKGLMFIPLNFDSAAPFYGYNFLYPAWTLTYELLFYSIFVLAISICHEKRGLIASLIILTCVIFLQLISNNTVSFELPLTLAFTQGLFKLLASPMLIEFIYGIIISAVISRVNFKRSTYISLSILSFIIFISLFECGVSNFHGPSSYGFAAIAVTIAGLTLERSGVLPKIGILDRLGDISYSLYLSHIIIFFAIKYYITTPFNINTEGSLTYFLLATGVALIISNLIFRYIEITFIRLGKSVTRRVG
ncbi:acyltransferase [Enterobacteriaceae bacterium 155047]|uniref:acyltransferase family protein n=1 Tax=Huaxiibacter chinensis TaxID=2899785 RepID=UPI0007DA6C8D|nr:acyltransferase [Huaxiibacter chinensis]ANG91857.1 acyltransferase [Lelliottia amnigena]MCG5043346.1 acyltransferase [Huaxiibacter chinensis]